MWGIATDIFLCILALHIYVTLCRQAHLTQKKMHIWWSDIWQTPYLEARRHKKQNPCSVIFLPRKTWSPFGDGRVTGLGIHPLTGRRQKTDRGGGRPEDEAQQCNRRRAVSPPLSSQQACIRPQPFIHPPAAYLAASADLEMMMMMMMMWNSAAEIPPVQSSPVEWAAWRGNCEWSMQII